MNRIRETLARLKRASRESRDKSSGPRLDRVGRTSSSAGSSREKVLVQADGRGPLILYDGIQPGEEGIDIVLVHGLFGARVSSWTKGSVCWPRDLLGQDVPNVRVIAWGWNSLFGGKDIFAEHAETFLSDIARVCSGMTRPLVFIGHGLGGLILKEALVTAAVSRIYGSHVSMSNAYPRAVGCIFLGTPHTRVGKRSLGECIAAAATISPSTPSPQLLRALKDNDQHFENQHNTFKLVSRDIRVVCIREKLPTTLTLSDTTRDSIETQSGRGTVQVMVPRESAAYENFNVTRDDMPTNHMDLARFRSREVGYTQIIAHIAKITSGPSQDELEAREPRNQGMPSRLLSLESAHPSPANHSLPEILNALYYDTMMERESRIDRAYGHTCDWILDPELSPFTSFLSSQDPVLWISGEAGSGKSTLMKYAWHAETTKRRLEEGWAKNGELLMAAFFMFEGGNRIQKTYEGFLRSVLYQILSARQDLIRVAFPSFYDCPWPPPVQFTSTTNLNQGFYSLFSHMSERLRLFVFIDGVDEYRIMERKDHYEQADLDVSYDKEVGDESWGRSKWRTDSNTEIAKLVSSMGNKDVAKFVVSSRELPIFEESFEQFPRIRLQEHTESSVTQYVAGRLENEAPGLPDSKNLCREIARKSGGDILWARLAIDMVAEGTLKSLRKTLNSLPAQLGGTEGLYMRMIENLTPDNQTAAYSIFHLVLRAQQPPTLVTLAFADQGYLDPNSGKLRVVQDSIRREDVTSVQQLADQMQRRLQVCCAGLLEAEVLSGSNPIEEAGQRVVFTHQTTKEWVGRRDIWHKLPGIQQVGDVDLDCALLSGCVRTLKAFEAVRPPVLTWPNMRFRPDAWLLVANSLRYAERIDSEVKDVTAYAELLDELNATNQRAWLAALDNHKPLVEDPDWYERKLPNLRRKHWSSFEPMEAGKSPKRKDFLSLVVQANLVRYVALKLGEMDRDSRRRKAQELLVYAVSPKGDGFSACVNLSGDYLDFHHDMPDTRLLDILFEAGADPRDDEQIWMKALKAGRHYFSRGSATMTHLMETWASKRLSLNRERWVAAVKSLLLHGANPHAELQVTTGNEENRSTTTVVAVDLIRDTLEGEPDYALDLLELEALMGRRESVGLAR
ncbi:Uu.00g109590.m01.CDS01 [Anthostomella pinea]|uniref:Uu.00g109590.m01.CDS01 n=1 Tax=Anthostomella pinea TaxID=933095 RepID=A0AAI8VFF1_9PEZI|nr:Uu.00g109590.m01.CDS01 [Anthostomella pinea]